MPIGNLARGLANYKGAKFGLRTLARHPLLAIAFGLGALWFRKRQSGGRRDNLGGLRGGLGASLRRADPMPDRWAR
jgi:hypothetical protein